MPAEFYAFGEILWDCLPSGKHAGGAPFNVAAHLAQIGVSSALISCVGRDPLGDEILEVAGHKRVNVEFVTRARIGLPTGTVLVTLDEHVKARPGQVCARSPKVIRRLSRFPKLSRREARKDEDLASLRPKGHMRFATPGGGDARRTNMERNGARQSIRIPIRAMVFG